MKCFVGNSGNDVFEESLQEQSLRLGEGDAALLEIEQGVGVELACGGTVGALDVVGVDLQLRARAHLCLAREKDIAVGLEGLGFLRIGQDLEFAVERSAGTVGQHVLEELVAGSASHIVQDMRLDIHGLRAAGERQSIQAGGTAGLVLGYSDFDMRVGIGEREDVQREFGVLQLSDMEHGIPGRKEQDMLLLSGSDSQRQRLIYVLKNLHQR